MTRGNPRRIGVWRILATLLASTVLLAGPAAADPPGPTSWESQVIGLQPPADGVRTRVVGGDSFLQLVNGGHEVVVLGYSEGEQYLRFESNGDVYVNLRSEAYWVNQQRYGVVGAVPDDIGPEFPPRWVKVAADGSWAWHDHRVHWMSPTTLPADIDPTIRTPQPAFEWSVDLLVDGEPVTVTGSLTWLPPASPIPTLVAALVTVVVGVGILIRGSGVRAVAALVGVGVVLTGIIGLASTIGVPSGVQAEPLPLVLPAVSLLVLTAGLASRARSPLGVVVAGAAGVPLMIWAVTQASAVTAPLVPPDVIPAVVTRIAVGVAGAGGLVAVAAGLVDLFRQPLVPEDA